MSIVIKRTSLSLLDRLVGIEAECFKKEALTKKQIMLMLNDHNSISLVSTIWNEIAGFIIGRIVAPNGIVTGHILTVDVSRRHRRKGVGLALMKEIEEEFRRKGVESCFLEVRENNTGALKLYLEIGYKIEGTLKNYYGDEDAIRLVKRLDKP